MESKTSLDDKKLDIGDNAKLFECKFLIQHDAAKMMEKKAENNFFEFERGPSSTLGKLNLEKCKEKFNVILFFYPKDSTPGCTREAKSFSDLYPEFLNRSTLLFGVSMDNAASHEKFIQNHCLEVPLILDESCEVSGKYNAVGEKSLFMFKYTGITRMTVMIGKDLKIRKIWDKVSISEHASQVMEEVKASERESQK